MLAGSQCGANKICVINGIALIMDADLAVYALTVQNDGRVLWRDEEMGGWLSQHSGSFLCVGFVVIETSSKFEMSVLDPNNMTWVYITKNGAYHSQLKTRDMQWKVGDCIAVAPTKEQAAGDAEDFVVRVIRDNVIDLDRASQDYHAADIFRSTPGESVVKLQSAGVIYLSRNVIITGDDIETISCRDDLPEAVPGETTFREKCH